MLKNAATPTVTPTPSLWGANTFRAPLLAAALVAGSTGLGCGSRPVAIPDTPATRGESFKAGAQQKSGAAQPDLASPGATPSRINNKFAGISIAHEDWLAMGYRLDWVGYPFAAQHNIPIVAAAALGDVVVIQDSDGTAALLETSTGQRRWGTSVANPLTKFVGISRDTTDAGRILISSESEGYLVADASGNLVAKIDYQKVVSTEPVMIGRLAIFGTATGEVLAHVVPLNVKGWGFQTAAAIEVKPALLEGGVVGVVNQAGDVYFITSRGELVGRNRILGPVATDPATDGASLYIAGLDQSVWAFSGTGGLKWRHRTSQQLRDKITYLNGVVYVAVPGTGLVALDTESGKTRWEAAETIGTVVGLRDKKLIVQTRTGVDQLDPASGQRLGRIETPGMDRIITDKPEDGNLYIISKTGVVGRFIPKM